MIKLAPRLQTSDRSRASQAAAHGPVERGKPYHEIALTAWLAAQVAAWEALETETRLIEIAVKLDIAAAWFVEHGEDDPLYRKAEIRRNRLEREQRLLTQQHWFQLRTCWTACCQVWQALSLMADRDAWVAEHAAGELDVASFETVWASAIGERPLPEGLSYPPSSNGHEFFIPFAPWMAEELGERKTAQRKRSTKRRKRVS